MSCGCSTSSLIPVYFISDYRCEWCGNIGTKEFININVSRHRCIDLKRCKKKVKNMNRAQSTKCYGKK